LSLIDLRWHFPEPIDVVKRGMLVAGNDSGGLTEP
jgi:hypothetical protein